MTRPAVSGPAVPGPVANRPVANRPAVTDIGRTLTAVAAVGAGAAASWLIAGSVGVLAGMAVMLAAGNGYAKAYSP